MYNDTLNSSLIKMKGVGFSRNYEFHYYYMKDRTIYDIKVGFSPLNLSSLSVSDNVVIPGSVYFMGQG